MVSRVGAEYRWDDSNNDAFYLTSRLTFKVLNDQPVPFQAFQDIWLSAADGAIPVQCSASLKRLLRD
jgi:hypothetical protein